MLVLQGVGLREGWRLGVWHGPALNACGRVYSGGDLDDARSRVTARDASHVVLRDVMMRV